MQLRSEAQLSYLLRRWRSGSDGNWRAALQSVQSGKRHLFADLESLLGFLCDHTRPPRTTSPSCRWFIANDLPNKLDWGE